MFMQNLNQKTRLGRVNKKPVMVALFIALMVLLMGAYVSYQRSYDNSEDNQAEKDSSSRNLQLGKNMVDHLESMAKNIVADAHAQKADSYFIGDYENYKQKYEEPEPLKLKVTPFAPPLSVPEQAQAELKKHRASALLQALQASSSIDNSSTNKPPRFNLSAGNTNQGLAPHASTEGTSLPLSTSEQNYLDHAYNRLAAMKGAQGNMSTQSASTSRGTNLSAYQRLVNNHTHLNSSLQSPSAPYVINQGAVIPCVLLTGINSDLPGLVQAQVSEDVYDSLLGHHVLIPKGSKVIGQYASAPMMGQERLMIAFNRLIYPNGQTLNLEAMPGSSHDGYAGFNAQVDNHFWSLLTNAVLLGGVSAGISLSVDDARNDEGELTLNGALSQNLGQSLGRVMTQVIERNLNTSPTLKVKPGFAFNVTLVKDLQFNQPY